MDEILLKQDDERVGHYNEDGSTKSWPVLNMKNQTYRRGDGPSTLRLDATHFVVLPAQWDMTTPISLDLPKEVKRGKASSSDTPSDAS